MGDEPIRVLLVEDDEDDFVIFRDLLSEIEAGEYELEWVSTYASAREALEQNRQDVCFLDYRLGEHNGLELLQESVEQGTKIPIVLLTGSGDREVDVAAMKAGASGYLAKGQLGAALVERSIRYAIEHRRMREQLQNLSLIDELTGLYNRRGFMTLADQHMKLTSRSGSKLALLFADLDGLKWINDNLGHHDGDRAIRETGAVLKKTFRETDIIARMGGDEFAALLIDTAEESSPPLTDRVQRTVEEVNEAPDRRYRLSLSVGVVPFDPAKPCSLKDLLDRADSLMYEQKKNKRNPRASLVHS